MSESSGAFEFSAESFSGQVRLFPLPNLVMFPGVVEPFYVFEPRYQEMLADALEGDRLIAMATLRPGWEDNYEGRPAVQPVACLTRIAVHQPREDGTSQILLVGCRRIRLLEELPATRSFREARAEVLEDRHLAAADDFRRVLHRRLKELVMTQPERLDPKHELLEDMPLGLWADALAQQLPIDLASKLELLGEQVVERRAELLVSHLQRLQSSPPGRPSFPPEFSVN